MPIQRIAPNAPHSRPPPVSQIKKGRQERRLLKPVRVASAWQENIAAQVKPRSENRWRASRAQPLLATLLQFLMLSEQLKSVVSLPEAPGRLPPPVFPGRASDAGSTSASALSPKVPPRAQASGRDALEPAPPTAAAFRFLQHIAPQAPQAPVSNRRIRSAPEHSDRSVEQAPSAASTGKQDGAPAPWSADLREWHANAGAMAAAEAEPTLARADTPRELRYGSLDWADLQSGIDIASALGLGHWTMSYTELVALAQAADMAARLEPGAAAGLLAPQIRTALTFAGMAVQPDDMDAEARIGQAMRSLTDARSARWEGLQQRQQTLEALQAPIPTRSELAERILFEHGIHPDRIFLTPPLLGTPAVGGHVEPVADTARNLYLEGRRSLNNARLPDVDQQFDRAFTEYKDKARQAIALRYDETIRELPEEERTFWEKGKAQILAPEVRDEQSMVRGTLAMRPFGTNLRSQAKPFTAIVSIKHDGRTRHYLAATAGAQGRLIRFLAGELPRDTGHKRGKAEILDAALFPHIDDLFVNGGEIKAVRRRHWKLAPRGTPGAATSGVAKYFVEAIEKQRRQAYGPTANQQALQRVRDGLLSMIPFYNCVTEAQAGNTGSAAVSCTFDVVGLVPLAGTALKAGVGAGKLSVQIGGTMLKQLAQASARGILSRRALRSMISEMARAAPQAASLARSSGKMLAGDAAKLFDPGLRFAGSVGKNVVRGGRALVRRLRQAPGMQALADRVGAALKQKQLRLRAPDDYRAVPPHIRQELQVGSPVDDIGELWHFPESRRWPEFKRIVETAGALDPEQRNAQFIAAIRQIKHLNKEERYQAFELLSGPKTPDMPDILYEMRLVALADQIEHLDINRRLSQFNVLFEMTGKLPAGHPAALVRQIEHLAPEQRRDAFDRLLAGAAELDPQPRAAYLNTLGMQLRWLHRKDAWDGFDRLFREIELLPAQLGTTQLIKLVKRSGYIPTGSRGYMPHSKRLDRIIRKITGGSNETQRVAHLNTLIRKIGSLQEGMRMTVFMRIVARIETLGKERLFAGESSNALLDELRGQIRWLSTSGYNDRAIAELQIDETTGKLHALESMQAGQRSLQRISREAALTAQHNDRRLALTRHANGRPRAQFR
jgi:hypothetical protein